MTKLIFATTHCRTSNKRDFMILLNSIAFHLCSTAAQTHSRSKFSWFYDIMTQWFNENSWFHGAIHSYHSKGLSNDLVVLISFVTSPPLIFCESCLVPCIREANKCNHCDGLLRARFSNAVVQPRFVKKTYGLDIVILPYFLELQLCFHSALGPSNPRFSILG